MLGYQCGLLAADGQALLDQSLEDFLQRGHALPPEVGGCLLDDGAHHIGRSLFRNCSHRLGSLFGLRFLLLALAELQSLVNLSDAADEGAVVVRVAEGQDQWLSEQEWQVVGSVLFHYLGGLGYIVGRQGGVDCRGDSRGVGHSSIPQGGDHALPVLLLQVRNNIFPDGFRVGEHGELLLHATHDVQDLVGLHRADQGPKVVLPDGQAGALHFLEQGQGIVDSSVGQTRLSGDGQGLGVEALCLESLADRKDLLHRPVRLHHLADEEGTHVYGFSVDAVAPGHHAQQLQTHILLTFVHQAQDHVDGVLIEARRDSQLGQQLIHTLSVAVNGQGVDDVQQILVEQDYFLLIALGQGFLDRRQVSVPRKGTQQGGVGIGTGLQSSLLHHSKDALGRLQVVGLQRRELINQGFKDTLATPT